MQSLICCSDTIILYAAKTKGGWIEQCPAPKQVHFDDFSLPRNEGRPGKETLTGTCKLTFSLHARLLLPVMFLLQAFIIT